MQNISDRLPCGSAHEELWRVLEPGRNCWRIEPGGRAALLSNAEYFAVLAAAFRRARGQILLAGWELDPRLVLDPEGDETARLPLYRLFASLLRRRPGLEIRVLLWDRSLFYGGIRRSKPLLAELAEAHPGFAFRYIPAPVGGSHHEKFVCIDDELAFVGGIDLDCDRWDTPCHRADEPRRRKPDGEPYGPIHDVQLLVEGAAARAVADLFRAQWLTVAEQPVPLCGVPGAGWPGRVRPDFTGVDVAIARTDLTRRGAPIREIEQLDLDALGSARQAIFLESQYLTATAIGDALEQSLARPDGPEIVAVVTEEMHGRIETLAMGRNRDRLVRRLHAADRWNRLRCYFCVAAGQSGEVAVRIHAKLMVVDDRYLRVGSSNLNNRSLGLDTECDLAIEATDARARRAIRVVRSRVLGELLRCPAEQVEQAVRGTGSLIAAIDRLNGAGRLRPIPAQFETEPQEPLPATPILDPDQPYLG